MQVVQAHTCRWSLVDADKDTITWLHFFWTHSEAFIVSLYRSVYQSLMNCFVRHTINKCSCWLFEAVWYSWAFPIKAQPGTHKSYLFGVFLLCTQSGKLDIKHLIIDIVLFELTVCNMQGYLSMSSMSGTKFKCQVKWSPSVPNFVGKLSVRCVAVFW